MAKVWYITGNAKGLGRSQTAILLSAAVAVTR